MERIGKDRLKQRRKGFLALFAAALMLFNMMPMNALAAEYGFDNLETSYGTVVFNKGDSFTSTYNYSIKLDTTPIEGVYSSTTASTTTPATYPFAGDLGGTDRWKARKNDSGDIVYLKPVKRWTMTFDANGHGTAPEMQKVYENDIAPDIVSFNDATITATGYTFGGWYKEAGCENPWVLANVCVKSDPSAAFTAYAKWTANAYTVAFNANGGSGEMNNQARTYDDGAALTANAFTRTGYTFSGWNTAADGSGTAYADSARGNLSSTAGDTVTLYAQWTVNNFTVTFDSDGGSEVAAQSVAYGGKVTKPDAPTKEGYVFDKWIVKASDATSANNGTTETEWNFENDTISADTTLIAKWKIVAFTVTFDSDGGSEVAAQSVNRGEKVTKPENPTKEGFVFEKWVTQTTDNAGTAAETTETEWDFEKDTVTSDITLTAKWKIVAFTVTFDSDGGSEVAAQSVNRGEKVTKPENPTKEGFVFEKWVTQTTDNAGTAAETTETEWDFEKDTVTSDITLTAKWKIVAFTVTFDSDGGSEVAAQSVNRGEKVTKPDSPTKKGYTFDKWVVKDAEKVSAWDFDNDTVTSDITLYAIWNGDWNDSDSKQGLKEGYTDISDGIKKAGYDSESKIKDALYKSIVNEAGGSTLEEGQVIVDSKLYDVTFQVSFDGGKTYVAVTKDNFPAEGLVVTIPYPEGTSKDGNDFIVAHMFSEDMNGHAAGEIEKPAVTKADEGIQFRVSGLSPVLVSWTTVKKSETEPQTTSEPQSAPEPQPAPQARAPKTGDSPVALYVVIMLALAGVSLTAYSAFGRKRR